MRRADELKIQQGWRRNLEQRYDCLSPIRTMFANSRQLSVEQASVWLKATMGQALHHVCYTSTQPEQAFALLLERLRHFAPCPFPIHLCIADYQGSGYPDQTYYLIPELPIIETSHEQALLILSSLPCQSLSFLACSLPNSQAGVVLSSHTALPQPENGMFDGAEYELSHWGQDLAPVLKTR